MLRQILSKTPRPGLNLDQLVADIECLDALRTNRAEWIKRLEVAGDVALKPATLTVVIPAQISEKKNLERIRDGLSVLQKVFDILPPEKRREIGLAAFQAAAGANDDAGAALKVIFDTVLADIKATIAALSQSLPSSDYDLQRQAKLAGLVAVFRKHGLRTGKATKSPFVLVCKEFLGIPRTTVQAHLPAILKGASQYMQDVYGEVEASAAPESGNPTTRGSASD
jgi:hypothetical protein